MKKIVLFVLFFLFLFLIPGLAEAKKVLVIEVSGPITAGTLELFKSGFEEAKSINADALMVLLDTPGGGLAETLEIIKLIDRSNISVISYVHPTGATAWSAGTVILISSHVAAMSPNTIIGSAQPVALSPQGFSPSNETKIINALTALVAEKSRIHGRNESAAVAFIKENLNLNPEQAKKMDVIEHISPTVESLLNQLDGFSNAEIVRHKPSIKVQFLNLVANPMLASILLIIGIYALIFGFSSPGFGVEVAGVVLIALGLLGLGFNISIIAVFLVVFGVVLLLVELHTPGFGVLGAAGIISTIVGSILLIPTSLPRYYVSRDFQSTMIVSVIVPSIIFGILMGFALYKVAKIRKKKPAIGEMTGDTVIVTEAITPQKTGYVKYKGEDWLATSSKKVGKGAEAVITGKKGPLLIIKGKS